jgi:hypothetical protein
LDGGQESGEEEENRGMLLPALVFPHSQKSKEKSFNLNYLG